MDKRSLYIVAGNRTECWRYVTKNSLHDWFYVSSPSRLAGIYSQAVVYVGTFQDRPDLAEIQATVAKQGYWVEILTGNPALIPAANSTPVSTSDPTTGPIIDA